ncbi:MAG: response regulator, partial [Lachnospiraceae bacterium]|nr:response regulator [Lachnospiraceae bacterium]
MLKSHDKFHSVNGKRLILVADDEIINRMLLGEILSEEFEVIYAEDGTKALEEVRQNKDRLSLILLDIMMPELSGMEVLRVIKSDPGLSHIPVMVVTSDQESEIESLSLGASDFISKPYPPVGVILARVRRTIELSEDRQIIQVTERDALTGLYHREFFFSYADQFDLFHADMEMDAVVVDIQHFHMINERFGREYGDEVLRRIGERLLEMIRPYGGIVCRKEADTFL